MKSVGLAASRDSHLVLRRVERQHALIERLHAARGQRSPLRRLAEEFGVSERTVARDVERLRSSGVPIQSHAGRGGGVSMLAWGPLAPIKFDVAEIAALMSCLTALGPTASPSAASAMARLREALSADD